MTTSILVTGGTGPLGRPVAQWLRAAGASVTILSRRPRPGRHLIWVDIPCYLSDRPVSALAQRNDRGLELRSG